MSTHSFDEFKLIDELLKLEGVSDYRFCKENDCYVCDKQGTFYSVCKKNYSKSGNLIKKYRVVKLNGSVDNDGYVTYRITQNGIKKHLKAHRLMLNAWIGENENLVANHIDGNKKNNSLKNLEWCTVRENNIHALESGLKTGKVTRNDGPYRIPRYDWVTIYVLNKHCGYSIKRLAHNFGCSTTVMSATLQRAAFLIRKMEDYVNGKQVTGLSTC